MGGRQQAEVYEVDGLRKYRLNQVLFNFYHFSATLLHATISNDLTNMLLFTPRRLSLTSHAGGPSHLIRFAPLFDFAGSLFSVTHLIRSR